MHVAHGRQPAADVEELADALLSAVTDGAANELAVLPRDPGAFRERGQQLVAKLTVAHEVVFPAEQVVIDAGDVRNCRIESRAQLRLRAGCHKTELVSDSLTH